MAEQIPVRRHRLPEFHSYDVTADELDQIELQAMQVGLDFAFASISLTAFISFSITLLTVPIPSDRLFAGFFAVALAAGGFTAYFGMKWWRGRKRGVSIIQRIRQREVGPLGDESKPIRATELNRLPPQEPGGPGGAA